MFVSFFLSFFPTVFVCVSKHFDLIKMTKANKNCKKVQPTKKKLL